LQNAEFLKAAGCSPRGTYSNHRPLKQLNEKKPVFIRLQGWPAPQSILRNTGTVDWKWTETEIEAFASNNGEKTEVVQAIP